MWVTNSYSAYDSISVMLSNLGWCCLKYRHDLRLAMFYTNSTAMLQCSVLNRSEFLRATTGPLHRFRLAICNFWIPLTPHRRVLIQGGGKPG